MLKSRLFDEINAIFSSREIVPYSYIQELESCINSSHFHGNRKYLGYSIA